MTFGTLEKQQKRLAIAAAFVVLPTCLLGASLEESSEEEFVNKEESKDPRVVTFASIFGVLVAPLSKIATRSLICLLLVDSP
ncbi:unnamed protein product [Clavelina lepadiformis]|uniref:Uncharacterized protein n=1 Tax=Clavelina lepadiformis TaxID=159417 RepID=A0ABP0GJI0_CLALP